MDLSQINLLAVMVLARRRQAVLAVLFLALEAWLVQVRVEKLQVLGLWLKFLVEQIQVLVLGLLLGLLLEFLVD
jgi:hypothetical protein